MGSKRKEVLELKLYTPRNKRKLRAEANKSANVESSIHLTIPVYHAEDEIDPLCSGFKDNQTRLYRENANSVNVNSFPMESLGNEVKVEGESEMECQSLFPSTCDSSTGTTELIHSQKADDNVESKDDLESGLPEKFSQGIIEKTLSSERFNVPFELEAAPRDIKLEPDDVDLVDIKTEPLTLSYSNTATEFLKDVIEIEHNMIKEEYSEPRGNAVPDSLGGHGATANEVNNTAGHTNTSNMVLDPETGLFLPAGDANNDYCEAIPENASVPRNSELWNSWNDEDAIDYSTGPGKDQCSQPGVQLAKFTEQTKSLGHSNTPSKLSLLVSVDMLLDHPFSNGFWTARQQNEIFIQPVPLSKWGLKNIYYSKQIFLMEFDFNRFPWLCDSITMERFFCWSCLLLADSEHIWSVAASVCRGRDGGFVEELLDHESTLEHLNAQTTYDFKKKFICSSLKDRNLDACHKLWRRLVRSICLECRNNSNLDLEDPVFDTETLDIISKISPRNMPSVTRLQMSRKIHSFATHYLKMSLIDELRKAPYVTLHLEDLFSGVEDKTWIAVIARYAQQNGEIDETVIDFIKTSSGARRTASIALKWIKHIFNDFKLNENLVGFSYSASIILPHEISSFHKLILKVCPKVLFFHSPLENVHKSLFQAISHMSACRKYFKEVQGLCEFLDNNRPLIESVEKPNGPLISNTLPKIFDAHFTVNLRSYYSTLLAIVQTVINLNDCNPQVQQEAEKLDRFLQTPKNCIIMLFTGQMSSIIEGLGEALGLFNLDMLVEERIKSIKSLLCIKSNGLSGVREMTSDLKLARCCELSKSIKMVDDMIDTAVAFLTHTFENLDQFKYISPSALKSTLKCTKFPVQSLDFIERAGLNQNDVSQLKFLMYSPRAPLFIEHKNHTELLNFIIQNEKTIEFTGLHKYLLFAHLMSFAESQQKTLLRCIYCFCQNASPDGLTEQYLNTYFWRMENDRFEKILEDPELYFKALQVCQLKIVVENEYDVKMVEYSYFS